MAALRYQLLVCASLLLASQAFTSSSSSSSLTSGALTCRVALPRQPVSARAASSSTTTNDLLVAIQEQRDDSTVLSLIQQLEQNSPLSREQEKKEETESSTSAASTSSSSATREQSTSSSSLFEPLLGLYTVARTITARPGENPVGGKWTRSSKGIFRRLFQLRTTDTFQHLLPLNSTGLAAPTRDGPTTTPAAAAEAVNHIRLEAFGGRAQIHVLLRGDASPLTASERSTSRLPLSPRAVRAVFDPPRLLLRLLSNKEKKNQQPRTFALSVGPSSSVVLDTTYCDDQIRLGMGGTSGTRFVFQRITTSNENPRASEYSSLLKQPLLKKAQVVRWLGLVTVIGINLFGRRNLLLKLVGGLLSSVSLLSAALVLFSGGGIEQQSSSWHQQSSLRSPESEATTVARKLQSTTPPFDTPTPTTRATVASRTAPLPPDKTEAQQRYIPQPLNDEALKAKYASIDTVEDRAYQILVDLGMVAKNEEK